MPPIGEIYLIDDETEIRQACKQTFDLEGYAIRTFSSAKEVLPLVDPNWLGVIITDVRMPDMDGLKLLGEIRAKAPELPVIILTGHGDVPMATRAMHAGAYDFLEKPAPPAYLVDVARRALETRRLSLENRALRKLLAGEQNIESRLLGNSQAAEQLRQTLTALATVDVDVLLIGETGVGKELAARCLHDFGNRRSGKFVPLNCSAIPAELVESELFGHEKGAFTSASDRRIGKVELSQGGTLFLDEIESMPTDIQIKLLRTLQERVIERVGSNRLIPIDFRIIAATKVDLREAVNQGTFREDLFYRLNVARVPIPTLRERSHDIVLLLNFFMNQLAEKYRVAVPQISEKMQQTLTHYSWPGNIRELRNIAQQLLLNLPLDLSPDGRLETPATDVEDGLEQQLRNFEKHLIIKALENNRWRIEKTAESLKIPRKKLYLRMKKFNLHQ